MSFLVLNWIFKIKLKIFVFVYYTCTCFFFFLKNVYSKSKQQSRICTSSAGGLPEYSVSPMLSHVNILQVRGLKSNETLYVYYLINKK